MPLAPGRPRRAFPEIAFALLAVLGATAAQADPPGRATLDSAVHASSATPRMVELAARSCGGDGCMGDALRLEARLLWEGSERDGESGIDLLRWTVPTPRGAVATAWRHAPRTVARPSVLFTYRATAPPTAA